MLQYFLILLLILPTLLSDNDNEKTKVKAGNLTYQHFLKATNDNEMRLLLIANYQNPKEFEGLSRMTICEKMRMKAIKTGREYTQEIY